MKRLARRLFPSNVPRRQADDQDAPETAEEPRLEPELKHAPTTARAPWAASPWVLPPDGDRTVFDDQVPAVAWVELSADDADRSTQLDLKREDAWPAWDDDIDVGSAGELEPVDEVASGDARWDGSEGGDETWEESEAAESKGEEDAWEETESKGEEGAHEESETTEAEGEEGAREETESKGEEGAHEESEATDAEGEKDAREESEAAEAGAEEDADAWEEPESEGEEGSWGESQDDAWGQSDLTEADSDERKSTLVRDLLLLALLILTVAITVLLVRSVLGSADTGKPTPSGASSPGPRRLDQRPPPEARDLGSYVESRIAADGDVHVTEWIKNEEPLSTIELEVPPQPDGSTSARATGLSVAADRNVVDVPDTVDADGRRLRFDPPAKVVHLRYTLHGLVERSPSAPGRALIRATALKVSYGHRSGPVRIVVINDNVLSAACSASRTAAPRPCGAPADGRWNVVLHGRHRTDSVMAQVNLS